MKIVLILLITLHGMLHLLGFAKAYELAAVTPLTQAITKTYGLFWLFAALSLIAAGGLLLADNSSWWMLVVPGLLLSQYLIITSWHDAKFGTIANLAIALAIIIIAIKKT